MAVANSGKFKNKGSANTTLASKSPLKKIKGEAPKDLTNARESLKALGLTLSFTGDAQNCKAEERSDGQPSFRIQPQPRPQPPP